MASFLTGFFQGTVKSVSSQRMSLPRLQLFELEDLPWFPRTIRDLATDYLHFIETRFRLHESVIPILRDALEYSNAASILDLCSGAGGPVLSAYEALAAGGLTVPFTLTDKYPNLSAFRLLSERYPSGIRYLPDPIDAANVPRDLAGFRTMFNAFHHFSPESAHRVLICAVEARQPIGIFEIPERSTLTIIPLLFTPLFMAMATPFIRPFRWRRLLWTYLIPLVPLTGLWDGLISQLRAYTTAELLELTRDLPTYEWKAGSVPLGGSLGHLTFLVGHPSLPNVP
jgi:hypothetical protein